MSTENSNNRVLWVVLSALGMLGLAMVAGIILFMDPTGKANAAQLDNNDTVTAAVQGDREQVGDSVLDNPDDFLEVDPVELLNNPEEVLDMEPSEREPVDGEIVINWDPDKQTTETVVKVQENPVEKTIERVEPVHHAPENIEKTPAVVKQTKQVKTTVYWIQVASFPSSFKAEMLSQSLSGRGVPATIQTQDVNGKTWYRIRVGTFTSQEEASSFQKQIEGMDDIKDTYIVQSYVLKEVAVN